VPSQYLRGRFEATFLHLIQQPETRISFNLTGMRPPLESVYRMQRTDLVGGSGRFTNWEFHQIEGRPEVLTRTTFYRDGQVTDTPFDFTTWPLV
jgi:hypothetical protein